MSDRNGAIDKVVGSLLQKRCPLHGAMQEVTPLRLHGEYIRNRYRCFVPHCECEVAFVENEIKTDSVARTVEYLIVSDYIQYV